MLEQMLAVTGIGLVSAAGLAYQAPMAIGGTRLEKPIIHHRWRRLVAEEIANSTTA